MSEKDEKEYLTLSFDDGEDVEYEVVGVIDVEDSSYIVMIPETDEGAIEIFGLAEVEDDPDSEEITIIEDDDEYKAVVDALRDQGFKIVLDDEEIWDAKDDE